MIIDFDKIKEEVIMNFKCGEGELDTRNFVDENNKIMLSSLLSVGKVIFFSWTVVSILAVESLLSFPLTRMLSFKINSIPHVCNHCDYCNHGYNTIPNN